MQRVGGDHDGYHVTADSLSEMNPMRIKGQIKEKSNCTVKIPNAMRAATSDVDSPFSLSSIRATISILASLGG